MGFAIQTRAVGPVLVLEAVGRFTAVDGHTKLRDLIHVLTNSGTKKFVLNMERVEFIDSSGIGELLRSHFVVRQAAGELKLASVNARVMDVLRISHMHTVFEIHPAAADALGAFGRKP
jgi:anti-sigma B factor antagonist